MAIYAINCPANAVRTIGSVLRSASTNVLDLKHSSKLLAITHV